MSRFHAFAAASLSALAASLAAASAAAAAPAPPQLDVYAGELSRAQLAKLVQMGVDRHELELRRRAARTRSGSRPS